MQHAIVELKEKLLRALDKDNNVVDPKTVFGVIASLEKSYITRECLEETRIGRYVNEMRKKTNDKDLAKRAKNLVRKWQQLVNVPPSTSPASFNGSKVAVKSAVPPHLKTLTNKPASPASRPITPGSNSNSPGLQRLTGRPGTPHNQTANRLSPASAKTSSTNIAFKPISPALQTTIRSNSSACLSRKSPHDTARAHNGHSDRSSTPSSELDFASAAETRKPLKRKAGEQNCEIPEKKPYSADKDSVRVGSKSVINGLVKAPQLNSVDTASHKYELSSDQGNGLVTPAKKHSGKQLLRTPSASSMHSDTLDSMSTSSLKTPARTPRVKTTAQLLEEMASKGSLNIAGSEAVRKIALNQIDKEHDTDSSVVPAGAKPRPRKKPRTLVPPSPTNAKTLHETKHEMVHKFLETSLHVPPTPEIDLHDSTTPLFASARLHGESPTSGIDTKNNHNSSFVGNGSFHAVDKKRSHRSDSPNDIGDSRRGSLDELSSDTRRVSPVRIKLSMRRDKHEQNLDSAMAKSSACIISNNSTSTQYTSNLNHAIANNDPWSLLPEVDTDSINWNSLDYEPPDPLEVTPSVIDRLHTQQWTGANGQRDTWGDWRSWTQTYTASSYNGDLLHILPYVVLDEEEERLNEEDPLLASLGVTEAESAAEEDGGEVTNEQRMDVT